MRRISLLLIALAVASTGMAVAQEGPGPEQLREQIMRRLFENYRAQAGLTPEQEVRFREVLQQSMRQRQELMRRERETWQALEGQMRPGVAANPDSVTRLMDGLVAVRAAQLDRLRAEHREYATFLTPVQRAQLFIMWERLEQQVEQVRRRMMDQRRRPPPDGAF